MSKRSYRRVLLAAAWRNEPFAVELAQYASEARWHLDLEAINLYRNFQRTHQTSHQAYRRRFSTSYRTGNTPRGFAMGVDHRRRP